MPLTVLYKNGNIMLSKGQKQLYSNQNKMPLIKPMVGRSPDGWILFILGPFDATHNGTLYYKIVLVDIQMK